LWRNRDFRLLFGAQIVSLLGSGVTTVGLLICYSTRGMSSVSAQCICWAIAPTRRYDTIVVPKAESIPHAK
jgi:hypothetical protein